MTKRMIDADALLELIKSSLQAHENEYCQWTIERVLEKINELATPAPEPQTITFKKIPAIERILDDYYKPEKTYHVNFKCSILFGYGMTKEDAEKKCDEWNAGKPYNPPARVFEDDSDFPELYLEQYDDEFKLLLHDYIKHKNKKPQESIFDAEGWRTDFENIPRCKDFPFTSELVLLYPNAYGEQFVDYFKYDSEQKLSKFQNFFGATHWRPLPNTPQEA